VWLSKEVYDGLFAYWESDKFKEKSSLGMTNRTSPLGLSSSVHCGGSIPHSKYRRRLVIRIFYMCEFILPNYQMLFKHIVSEICKYTVNRHSI